MAEPFLGEIRMFGGKNIPGGWMACSGQTLQIQQYQALYAVLGTQFGGNGSTTFQLPNLNGAAPLCPSATYAQGKGGGEATHTLTIQEMPQHNHLAEASSETATTAKVAGNYWAGSGNPVYANAATGAMAATAISTSGASMPHQNMQPYLALNFCIAVQGIYPPKP